MERIDATPEEELPEDQVILPGGESLSDYAASRGITADINAFQPVISRETSGSSLLSDTLPPASDPVQKKKDVISKMLLVARKFACGRSVINPCTDWNFLADPSDPIKMPAQTGLTYISGGKNPYVRTLPEDKCPEMTYGMDCSGLVYIIAKFAGISLPPGDASTQGKPGSWTIPKEWNLQMKQVQDGSVESGDIVGWSDHVGIAESDGSTTSVYVISSTGRPRQCYKNITPPHGPRSLRITTLKTTPPTTTLRLTTNAYDGTYVGSFVLTCPTCDGGSTTSGAFSATVIGGVFTGGGGGIPTCSGAVSSSGVINATGPANECLGSVTTLTGQITSTLGGDSVMDMTYSRTQSAGCDAEYGTATATRQ